MTTQAGVQLAGPFYGSGSAPLAMPFTFRVFEASDVQVTQLDVENNQTVLVQGTDYTVSVNSNQVATPGGTVTMLWTAPTSSNFVITTDIPYDQGLVLSSAGGTSITNALDWLSMQIKQIVAQLANAAMVPVNGIGSLMSSSLVFGVNAGGQPVLVQLANIAQSTVSTFINELLGLASGDQVRGYVGCIGKNRIINGTMRMDQYNGHAAFSVPVDTLTRCGDRHLISVNGSGSPTAHMANTVNFGTGNPYALAIAGDAGTTNPYWNQRISHRNCADLAGQPCAVQAVVYQTTGADQTMSGAIYRANSQDNFSGTTLDSTVAWEDAVVPSGVPTQIKGTITPGASSGTGMQLSIGFTGSLDAGQAFYIQNVQLEKSSVPTAFEWPLAEQELAACQAYFAATNTSFTLGVVLNAQVASNGLLALPVPMRATPSIVAFPLGGTLAYTASGGGNNGSMGVAMYNNQLVHFYNSANNWTAGNVISVVPFAADAEL